MKGALVVILGSLVLASGAQAVTLVNPDGTPVGGQWQQWADEMRVPSVSGTLVFVPDNSVCPEAQGCATGSPYGAAAEVFVSPAPWFSARDTLYFELGHQFDWNYLTPRDRHRIERDLGYRHWRRWWDSAAALAAGAEDGIEAMFPAIYSDCAEGSNDNGGTVALWEPNWSSPYSVPNANPIANACVYIDQIARRVGADIESTAKARWR